MSSSPTAEKNRRAFEMEYEGIHYVLSSRGIRWDMDKPLALQERERSRTLVAVAAGAPAAAAALIALRAAGLRAAAPGGRRRGRHVALSHHRLFGRLLATGRLRVLTRLPAARRAVRRLRATLRCNREETIFPDKEKKSAAHCTASRTHRPEREPGSSPCLHFGLPECRAQPPK